MIEIKIEKCRVCGGVQKFYTGSSAEVVFVCTKCGAIEHVVRFYE